MQDSLNHNITKRLRYEVELLKMIGHSDRTNKSTQIFQVGVARCAWACPN